MSLIQEALKRQMEEQAQASDKAEPGQDTTPPQAMPDKIGLRQRPPEEQQPRATVANVFQEPPKTRQRKKTSAWLKSLILLVLLVLLVFALGYVFQWDFKSIRQHPLVLKYMPLPAVPEQSVAVPAQEMAAAHEEAAPVAEEAFVESPVMVEQPSVVEEAAAEPSVAEPDAAKHEVQAVAEELTPVVESPPPPAPSAASSWPALKLTGILANPNPEESMARINNQMLPVGAQIEGVTLLAIQPDRVKLEFNGETKFLKVGGFLY